MGLSFEHEIQPEIVKIKNKNEYDTISGIIPLYDIFQDKEEKPLLKVITSYKVDDIVYDEQCGIRIMNKNLEIHKMANEHIYIMAIDSKWNIRGLYNVSVGNWNSCNMCKSTLISFLVLIGAKAFSMYHNHPNGLLDASEDDINTYFDMISIGSLLDINFSGSYIVGEKEYCRIK